jgi:putative NADPH-quinone reductase
MKKVTIIDGHPDPGGKHFGNALASAYADGALRAGHPVERLVVATIDFPILRTAKDWNEGTPPKAIIETQRVIAAADHLAIFYPLWLGDLPAHLKAFLEQTFRPTFASTAGITAPFPKILKGKSARIVVTMGMPGLFYRWYYRAHSLKSLERNILKYLGVAKVRSSLFGKIETASDLERARWIERMGALGSRAS